jgi:pimeloyl-ACP methyl ester carboxylesterase
MDYRGVGFSKPILECGDHGGSPGDPDFLADCRNRLVAGGIDPMSYRSTDVASDIADLAGVLGYRKLALIGNSYGTRVAFTILRDYPNLAANAILDAATPLEADLFESAPATSERAFAELQKACAEDPDCLVRHPDPGQALDTALSHLAKAPIDLVLHPKGSKEAKLRLTPALFIGVLMQCFAPPLLPAIPALVSEAASGNYTPFAAILEYFASQPRGAPVSGSYQAVQCMEEMPFNSEAGARTIMQQHPRFAALSAYSTQAEACSRWFPGQPADPRENQSVASQVPVLFLSGRFDPIVDPDWADSARKVLPNSRHAVFPNAAHGALHLECGWRLAASFMDNPAGEIGVCFSEQKAVHFLADVDSAGIHDALEAIAH